MKYSILGILCSFLLIGGQNICSDVFASQDNNPLNPMFLPACETPNPTYENEIPFINDLKANSRYVLVDSNSNEITVISKDNGTIDLRPINDAYNKHFVEIYQKGDGITTEDSPKASIDYLSPQFYYPRINIQTAGNTPFDLFLDGASIIFKNTDTLIDGSDSIYNYKIYFDWNKNGVIDEIDNAITLTDQLSTAHEMYSPSDTNFIFFGSRLTQVNISSDQTVVNLDAKLRNIFLGSYGNDKSGDSTYIQKGGSTDKIYGSYQYHETSAPYYGNITGNVKAELYGGSVGAVDMSVAGATSGGATISGTKTVNVGNDVKITDNIKLESLSDSRVYITKPLVEGASVVLGYSSSFVEEQILATSRVSEDEKLNVLAADPQYFSIKSQTVTLTRLSSNIIYTAVTLPTVETPSYDGDITVSDLAADTIYNFYDDNGEVYEVTSDSLGKIIVDEDTNTDLIGKHIVQIVKKGSTSSSLDSLPKVVDIQFLSRFDTPEVDLGSHGEKLTNLEPNSTYIITFSDNSTFTFETQNEETELLFNEYLEYAGKNIVSIQRKYISGTGYASLVQTVNFDILSRFEKPSGLTFDKLTGELSGLNSTSKYYLTIDGEAHLIQSDTKGKIYLSDVDEGNYGKSTLTGIYQVGDNINGFDSLELTTDFYILERLVIKNPIDFDKDTGVLSNLEYELYVLYFQDNTTYEIDNTYGFDTYSLADRNLEGKVLKGIELEGDQTDTLNSKLQTLSGTIYETEIIERHIGLNEYKSDLFNFEPNHHYLFIMGDTTEYELVADEKGKINVYDNLDVLENKEILIIVKLGIKGQTYDSKPSMTDITIGSYQEIKDDMINIGLDNLVSVKPNFDATYEDIEEIYQSYITEINKLSETTDLNEIADKLVELVTNAQEQLEFEVTRKDVVKSITALLSSLPDTPESQEFIDKYLNEIEALDYTTATSDDLYNILFEVRDAIKLSIAKDEALETIESVYQEKTAGAKFNNQKSQETKDLKEEYIEKINDAESTEQITNLLEEFTVKLTNLLSSDDASFCLVHYFMFGLSALYLIVLILLTFVFKKGGVNPLTIILTAGYASIMVILDIISFCNLCLIGGVVMLVSLIVGLLLMILIERQAIKDLKQRKEEN